MADHFKDVNLYLRRGVNLGLRTKILHHDGSSGNYQQLYASFPENLVMAFCKKVRTERVKGYGKAVVVTGANAQAYNDVFGWLEACGNAKRVVGFPHLYPNIYYRTACMVEAAKLLDIRGIVVQMEKSLGLMALKQIHTDDIWRIYTDECCTGYKNAVAMSISTAEYGGHLKAGNAVAKLKAHLPEFAEDVRREVKELKRKAFVKQQEAEAEVTL